MHDHCSDESELDKASNYGHKSRLIDDNLQIEDDKKRPQHQICINIEPFDSQLPNQIIFTSTQFS